MTAIERGMPGAVGGSEGAVLVVDDEPAMLTALQRLFHSARLPVRCFASGEALLAAPELASAVCLVLDVRMPGLSGLEVQAELRRRGMQLPTIFLTGAADVPLAVSAMRDGALDFIEKPFEPEHLVQRVQQAMQLGRHRRLQQAERAEVQARLATLTPREREVLDLVVKGLTNKEIGRMLGTSHRTVDIHRSKVMEKMRAEALAELVRDVLLLGESGTPT